MTSWTTSVAIVAVLAMALAPSLEAHLAEPYYRVFGPQSHAAASVFAASGAGPSDIFLSHPWEAPLHNAVTGSRPHAVLLPGAPPVHGEDYVHYMASGGANATWLEERGIRYVISAQAPAAPHEALGAGVHRLLPPGT